MKNKVLISLFLCLFLLVGFFVLDFDYKVITNNVDSIVYETNGTSLDLEVGVYNSNDGHTITVNGDGTVNHIDVLQINRNIASQSSVFDTGTAELNAYRFKVANVTAINGSDTVLNHIDVLQINRKIANLSSIFDSLS